MGLILDRMQLCTALGVSDSSITAWEKDGLPVAQRGRGRGKKSFYDFDKVHAWCARTGRGARIDVLMRRPPAAGTEAALGQAGRENIAALILGAAAEWLREADAAGFNEPDFEVADLADLGTLFVDELADALEKSGDAKTARALRAATDSGGNGRPATLDQAIAKFQQRTTHAEASGHGQG